MSKGSLQSLIIEHLRGSVTPFTLNFEKGKKLSVIYGENGTGKSTICDALDFIGKGNVGSLDNRGLGKTNKYWHSVGKQPNDVSVQLESSNGICKALLTKTSVVVDPEEKRPRVEVLRRNQILRLVEAKPADRYSAIRKFIDVSGIETSETTLRQLIRTIENNLDVAVARVEENTETIQRFWESAGKPGLSAKEWAEEEISKDQAAIDSKKLAIESLKSAYEKLASYSEQYKSQRKSCDLAQEAVKNAESTVENLKNLAANEYFEIFDILQAAQSHFSKNPHPAVCPLCESAERIDNLPEVVNKRISEQNTANQFKSAQSTLKTKQQAEKLQNQRLEDLKARAAKDAELFSIAARNNNLPNNIDLPNEPFPNDPEMWGQWLESAPTFLENWRKIADSCAESKKFINTLKASIEALDNNSNIKRDLEIVLPKLKESLAVVEDERRKFSDEVLASIASDVSRLYEAVHPGENLNNVSLELDPDKRASLEISTEFYGLTQAPPQAYFSDSHLDTLGLCIFLALAQLEKPEETILVLDDVLGSVDEPHVDRLIEMLYSETLKFRHCIITTHYKPWKQKLRWGWLKNGQCQFIELTKWTSFNGISLIKSIPDIERLRLLLEESPPDPQLVCAKAGVVLEAALDFLTILYECQVPRRTDARYTLGDLLPAIDKKLRTALRVEHKQEGVDGSVSYIQKQLAPHLDELTRIAQARNVFGCHFNSISFELLDSDAIGFGNEVLALINALIDHDTGWPKNDKSGSYWATAGETRRLHPLVKPK